MSVLISPITIVGAGPAGLSAALAAGELGAKVLLIDENPEVGGQLLKQTHKFFGSKELYCGVRGIDIAKILSKKIEHNENIKLLLSSSAIGFYYENGRKVLAIAKEDKLIKVLTDALIVATGATENFLLFENNDLPGVYGAGAVQTLVNQYGIRPGQKAIMVGSGNIGLIVSYQLLQAGIEVICLVEILPKISGWLVHAAKLKRCGVPILTSHTIVKAIGENEVKAAVIAKVDKNFKPIKKSQKIIKVDFICLSVGLNPLTDLLWQANCKMLYIPELGGFIPYHNENMETTVSGIFVAGDAAGIEEASTAILEGEIAGIQAYEFIYGANETTKKMKEEKKSLLSELRKGPHSQKILIGRKKMAELQPSLPKWS